MRKNGQKQRCAQDSCEKERERQNRPTLRRAPRRFWSRAVGGFLAREVFHRRLHFTGALRPAGWLFFQSAKDNFIQSWIGSRPFRRRSKPAQRQFAGEHLVKDHTQRVNVRPMIDRARLLDLLGRHVMWCPERRATASEVQVRLPIRQKLGDAEIRDFHTAFAVQQDVLRFDVAMENAFVVRVL